MDKLLRDKRTIALFVVPGLVLFVGIVFVPIIQSITYSLFEGVPGLHFEFAGLTNYLRFARDHDFIESVLINLRFVLYTVIGQVALGLFVALLLFFYLRRGSALARTITFIPVVLPTVATGQIFVKIYEVYPQYGLLNSILSTIGLENAVRAWHGDPSTALLAVSVAAIWKGFGFHAIIMYAGLINIPDDIFDAAKIDGADTLLLLRRIVLPLLAIVIFTSVVLAVNGTLKEFEMPYVLTRGGPGRATTLVAMYMYQSAFTFSEYGYGSAIAVFLLAEGLVFTLVLNRVSRRFEVE